MTVTHVKAATATVICHGTAYAGQAGYFTGPLGGPDVFETSWLAQPAPAIRAPSARRFDRLNGSTRYILPVERRFASEDAAHAYAACDLPLLLPRGPAHLKIERTGQNTVYLPTAVLVRVTSRRTGLSLDITFEFEAGLPTLTAPT